MFYYSNLRNEYKVLRKFYNKVVEEYNNMNTESLRAGNDKRKAQQLIINLNKINVEKSEILDEIKGELSKCQALANKLKNDPEYITFIDSQKILKDARAEIEKLSQPELHSFPSVVTINGREYIEAQSYFQVSDYNIERKQEIQEKIIKKITQKLNTFEKIEEYEVIGNIFERVELLQNSIISAVASIDYNKNKIVELQKSIVNNDKKIEEIAYSIKEYDRKIAKPLYEKLVNIRDILIEAKKANKVIKEDKLPYVEHNNDIEITM